MPRIRSVATALPAHRYSQPEVRETVRRIFKSDDRLSVFDNAGVDHRHFVRPVEYYMNGHTFAERNRDWVELGLELAERAVSAALAKAGHRPADIDHLFFVTTTGLATPSLDALLCHRMGFRRDVLRHPLFGIGCAGGAGMLRRASELLRGRPAQRALALTVELCSLTFRNADASAVNLVGTALFGDGAAAAVIEGDGLGGPGAEIEDGASTLLEGSEGLMGWAFENDGLKLVLSPRIPAVVKTDVVPRIERFLAGRPVTHWILHPGGAKVLAAYGRTDAEIAPSRDELREHGNLSSAAVLFILDRVKAKAGDTGLVAAVGPGFGLELSYLRWKD